MTTRFAVAAARLPGRMVARGGETVVYNNGTGTVTITDAWFGNMAFRLTESGDANSRLEWVDKEIFIPVASLVIGGIAVEPVRGHRITCGTEVFQVSAPRDEKPARMDPQKKFWRIHTKQVA